MTQNEIKYVQKLMQLHKLITEGKGESDPAGTIRDELETLKAGGVSAEQMNLVSAWCYGLTTDLKEDRDYLFDDSITGVPAALPNQVGGNDANHGSAWIDAHRSSLPNNQWVAANHSGLLAQDDTCHSLCERLKSMDVAMEEVAIAFLFSATKDVTRQI